MPCFPKRSRALLALLASLTHAADAWPCPPCAPVLPRSPPPCVEPPPSTPAPPPPPPPLPPPPPPPRSLAEATADFDGDGHPESIRLFSDGTFRLFRGGVEVSDGHDNHAGFVAPFDPDRFPEGMPRLEVVDIDRRDRQRELMLVEAHGDEDPDGEFSFWVLRAGRLWPMLRRPGNPARALAMREGGRPTIVGDGTVRTHYDTCVRDADPSRRVRGITERVSGRYVLADGHLPRGELLENLTTTRRPSDCVMAACPVVHVGAAEERVGEILRDLRGAALERWQPLTLPASRVASDGILTVTLREEKNELTRLDGVYVEADGRRVAPEGCEADGGAWCEADGSRLTIAPGGALRLRFRVGAARSIRLWAVGYYDPLPAPSAEETPR